jgi:hypothetical protein
MSQDEESIQNTSIQMPIMSTRLPGAAYWRDKIRSASDIMRRVRGFFPPTLTGFLLLGLSASTFWFEGIRRQDFVLLAIGFVGTLAAVLACLLVATAAPFIHRRWKRGSTRSGLPIECMAIQETGFFPPMPRWLPLLEYSWSWEQPGSVEVSEGVHPDRRREFIIAQRRGVHSEICRRIVLRDVLGLAALEWTTKESGEVRFLPAKGSLDRMTLLDGLTGGDDLSDPRGMPEGDRVDMRQYTPGDSPRMILWKVYSRTRKLLVRVPERALTARPRFCAYFVAGPQDEPGAGFMRVILERGFLGGGWRFGADGFPDAVGQLDEALDILVRSAGVSPDAATQLPAFLQQAQKDGFSACLVVIPPARGLWVNSVVPALCNSALRIHAFTVLDGPVQAHPISPSWKRFVCRHEAGAGGRINDLAWMAHDFGAVPFPVAAIDRASGRVFGDARSLGTLKRAVHP